MLLKYIDTNLLSEKDSQEFFEKNEKEIMSIYSQYMTMYEDELKDQFYENDSEIQDTISVLTVSYLKYGTQEDVPDRVVKIQDDLDIEIENKFMQNLLLMIVINDACSTLVKEGMFKVKKENGKVYFSITEKGNKYVEQLEVNELEDNL